MPAVRTGVATRLSGKKNKEQEQEQEHQGFPYFNTPFRSLSIESSWKFAQDFLNKDTHHNVIYNCPKLANT